MKDVNIITKLKEQFWKVETEIVYYWRTYLSLLQMIFDSDNQFLLKLTDL